MVESFVGRLKLEEKLGAEPPGFIPGQIIHIRPANAWTSLDIFTPLGKASGVLFGLLFQFDKWGFNIQKVSEWTEVSPVHAQYYQLTTQQKQQLETQIKSALAGISTAVSDYELLAHDFRKYAEYLRYFENIEKGKKEKNDKLVRENEQTLKSIFIDQVDVHTGEGIALRLIAPRWPTIIADFMQLKDKDVDPKKIAVDYKVSEAEGVVLSTKNKLFVRWKEMFKKTVEERFERLRSLMEARKKSIEEYRGMVKPYITRYRSIRELGETEEGRRILRSVSWFRPAVQAVSIDVAEYWVWKPFFVAEIHKAPSASLEREKKDILRMRFPREFKEEIRENWDAVKAKYKEVNVSPTGIEPLDKWVLYFRKDLEKHYNLKLSTVDILKTRDDLIGEYARRDWPRSPYFMVIEMKTFRTVVRLPDGSEAEDIVFGDPLQVFLDTQNVMLLRYMEMRLIEKEFERYISDMLGETAEGRKIEETIKEEFPYLKGEKPKEEKMKKEVEKGIEVVSKIGRIFRLVRPGPYESTFQERVASTYFKEMAPLSYGAVVRFIKSAAGVR